MWPSSRPATTTASTPDPWISSAATYATNGVTSDRLVSMHRVGHPAPYAAHDEVEQQADEHAAGRREHEVEAHVEDGDLVAERTAVPAPPTAIAVRSATRAVASFSSDSPSRIVTIRRGMPIRRAIAVAETASGGATTAPRAKAAGQVTAGMTV